MDPSSDSEMRDDDVSQEVQSTAGSKSSQSNEEDIEVSDEEDSEEKRYDDSTEDLPCHPVYDKDFAQVESDLAKMAVKVMNIIEQSGCHNDRAKGCLEQAKLLLNLPDTKKEIIALIGESGVGKSSVINSLLNIPKLARAVSSLS
jgi:ABC-type glutathione transport system ATPase component